MERMKKLTLVLSFMWILMFPTANLLAQALSQEHEVEESVLVGRISYVEGSVLRYIPEEGDWVQIVHDAPFGLEDKLRLEKDSKAEIIMPNNTWARMDGKTHIQLISLKSDRTEMHMVHGVARFYNKGSHSVITVTTPFGYVTAPAQTSFDLYVSDTSVEVIALSGSVYFTRDTDQIKAEVIEGSPSLVADRYTVSAGKGYGNSDWNAWNTERDVLWAKRMRAGGRSLKHLPESLYDHAYILDDYGKWEWVYYEGIYGYLWRPIYVDVGWSPFTVGSWTLWYGDYVWVPCEPFGYVTHHYGSWVHIRGYWYWAPPVSAVSVHLGHPALSIRFAWYPGRVAWFHFGVNIGWIPLAPHERYYSHRHWGPRSIIVKNVNIENVNIKKYRNLRNAIIINNRNLHATDNYRDIIIRNPDTRTIVHNYKPGFRVHKKLSSRDRIKERYSFKSVGKGRKFHTEIAKAINKHDPSLRALVKTDDIGDKNMDSRQSNAMKRKPITPLKNRHEVSRFHEVYRGSAEGKGHSKDIKANVKRLSVGGTRVGRTDHQSQRIPKEKLNVVRKGVGYTEGPVHEKPPVDHGIQFLDPKRPEQRELKRAKPQINRLPSYSARKQHIRTAAPKPKKWEIPNGSKPESASHFNKRERGGQRSLRKQMNSFSKRGFPSHRNNF